MTDRELLERAARAAGMNVLTVPWPNNPEGWFWCEHSNKGAGMFLIRDVSMFWNPLTDDGDALRLAVKLTMDLSLNTHHCIASAATGHIENTAEDGDINSATRRAIVRAAASMAKDTP